MKTLLILTGPQGSGNHAWSKIFALHPAVQGWSALLDDYWIGHDQEPFNHCWRDPAQLKRHNWGTHNYFVTSVSVPYMHNGEPGVPNFKAFVTSAQDCGLRVVFAVLGRDRNVVEMQQSRVRGAPTLSQALTQYKDLATPVFLSYELLHLYGTKYLASVSQQLGFPIALNDSRLNDILKEDTNAKYFVPALAHATDDMARTASSRKS